MVTEHTARPRGPHGGGGAHLAYRRILVIGNEQGYAGLLHAVFAGTDSTIDLAPDEEAGDVRLAQAPHDLVILALPLPGADGPAVCRRLRAAGLTLPIVMLDMLDGRGLLANLVAGFEAGADSYVAQPISVDELRAHLGVLAHR